MSLSEFLGFNQVSVCNQGREGLRFMFEMIVLQELVMKAGQKVALKIHYKANNSY